MKWAFLVERRKLELDSVPEAADNVVRLSTYCFALKLSTEWKQQPPARVCRSRSCQALPGLIKWSATPCIVTARWVLAVAAMSCGALMPKSGLSWWMGSLSPSNYRWIFRCIHYLCWLGYCVCTCVCVRGLLLHWLNCRGSAGVCWWGGGGVQGFLFQLCCRLPVIFMSCVGISVLCSAHMGSPSQSASLLHHTLSQVLLWLSACWQLGLLLCTIFNI